jgi:hypothetical protein
MEIYFFDNFYSLLQYLPRRDYLQVAQAWTFAV